MRMIQDREIDEAVDMLNGYVESIIFELAVKLVHKYPYKDKPRKIKEVEKLILNQFEGFRQWA